MNDITKLLSGTSNNISNNTINSTNNSTSINSCNVNNELYYEEFNDGTEETDLVGQKDRIVVILYKICRSIFLQSNIHNKIYLNSLLTFIAIKKPTKQEVLNLHPNFIRSILSILYLCKCNGATMENYVGCWISEFEEIVGVLEYNTDKDISKTEQL